MGVPLRYPVKVFKAIKFGRCKCARKHVFAFKFSMHFSVKFAHKISTNYFTDKCIKNWKGNYSLPITTSLKFDKNNLFLGFWSLLIHYISELNYTGDIWHWILIQTLCLHHVCPCSFKMAAIAMNSSIVALLGTGHHVRMDNNEKICL